MESIVSCLRKVAVAGEEPWDKLEEFFEEYKEKKFTAVALSGTIIIPGLELSDITEEGVNLDAGVVSIHVAKKSVTDVSVGKADKSIHIYQSKNMLTITAH